MTFFTTFLASLLALYVGLGIPTAVGVILAVVKTKKQIKERKEKLDDFFNCYGCN